MASGPRPVRWDLQPEARHNRQRPRAAHPYRAVHLRPSQVAQRARLRAQHQALRRFPAAGRWLLAGPDPASAAGWPAGFVPLDAQW